MHLLLWHFSYWNMIFNERKCKMGFLSWSHDPVRHRGQLYVRWLDGLKNKREMKELSHFQTFNHFSCNRRLLPACWNQSCFLNKSGLYVSVELSRQSCRWRLAVFLFKGTKSLNETLLGLMESGLLKTPESRIKTGVKLVSMTTVTCSHSGIKVTSNSRYWEQHQMQITVFKIENK